MTQPSMPAVESTEDRALRIALANREQIDALEDLVGKPAVASKVGDEGTGAMQVLFRLNVGIQRLTSAVDNLSGRIDKQQDALQADITARKAEADAKTTAAAAEKAAAEAAAAKRREPVGWAAKVAIGAAITTVVVATLGLAAATFSAHWHWGPEPAPPAVRP